MWLFLERWQFVLGSQMPTRLDSSANMAVFVWQFGPGSQVPTRLDSEANMAKLIFVWQFDPGSQMPTRLWKAQLRLGWMFRLVLQQGFNQIQTYGALVAADAPRKWLELQMGCGGGKEWVQEGLPGLQDGCAFECTSCSLDLVVVSQVC